MRIVVRASEEQKKEWMQKPVSTGAQVQFILSGVEELEKSEADIFFDLLFDERKPVFLKTNNPVFVNAVIATLNELPTNYIRLNAWHGFLQRDIVEIAAAAQKETVATVMSALNWKYKLVPDVPGMIAIRIISMIINEAYFALGDKVSTKEEIDIAMKLGTNYPYGPFEWSEKIGLNKIYFLIKKLHETESRYEIATLLSEEAMQKFKL